MDASVVWRTFVSVWREKSQALVEPQSQHRTAGLDLNTMGLGQTRQPREREREREMIIPMSWIQEWEE